MKTLLYAALALFTVSCIKKPDNITETPAEKLATLAVSLHDSTEFEIKGLYKYTTDIPYADTIHLGHILKNKSFTLTEQGQGNYPPLGPRIMVQNFQKADCECIVSKIYYATLDSTLFRPEESIECHTLKK